MRKKERVKGVSLVDYVRIAYKARKKAQNINDEELLKYKNMLLSASPAVKETYQYGYAVQVYNEAVMIANKMQRIRKEQEEYARANNGYEE